MNSKQEAWQLLHFEWKRYSPDWIISCLSAFLLGLLAAMLFNNNFQISISEAGNSVNLTGLFLDSIFLGLFPFFAVVLTTRMPGSLTKAWEIYMKRLAVIRTLPLSTRGFVRARMFQGIFMLLLHFAVFFSTIYLLRASEAIPLFTYLSFIAIWLGYGLFVGGWFIFMEWVIESRSLLKCLGLYLMMVIGLVVFDMWLLFSQINNSLVAQTIQLAHQYPWIGPLAILCGCFVLLGWSQLIEKRVLARELS